MTAGAECRAPGSSGVVGRKGSSRATNKPCWAGCQEYRHSFLGGGGPTFRGKPTGSGRAGIPLLVSAFQAANFSTSRTGRLHGAPPGAAALRLRGRFLADGLDFVPEFAAGVALGVGQFRQRLRIA